MARGALIVFEGCDRVGKSTQCKRLLEALHASGNKCQQMHFPDRSTKIGEQISDYLQKKIELPDRTIHLLFSANRWELESDMKMLLNSGTTLIVDRYAFSGVAYTAAKMVAPLSWCKGPDIGIPCPDRVFYLKLSAAAAEKRDVYGKERYEKVIFQGKVADQFEAMKGQEWLTMDASKDIDTLHSEILTETLKVINGCAEQPISKLWTDKHSANF